MSAYGPDGEGHDTYLHEDWALLEDAIVARYAGRAWPEALAAMHLRWLVIERRLGNLKPGDFPTVRELQAKWGWKSTDRVGAFLKNVDAWQDPKRRMTLQELRGDRLLGANRARAADGERTASGRRADGERTAETEQPAENMPVADGERTASGRRADGERTSRASSPRVSTDPPTTVPEGVSPAPAREPRGQLPAWAPQRGECAGHPRDAVVKLVVQAVEAARGVMPDPHRCGTAAKPVLALWRRLGAPDPEELAAEIALVAAWAQDSGDALAVNDIRGLRATGEAWGPDRSRDLATLCVQDRWDTRLEAARRWDAAGRPRPAARVAVVGPGPAPPPPRPAYRNPVDERRRALDALDHAYARLE